MRVVLAILSLLAGSAHAGIEWRVTPEARDWGWQVSRCKDSPECLEVSFPGGDSARVVIFRAGVKPRATVAGILSGARAVYAATATGGRGKKLGDLEVGTPKEPRGVLCDFHDRVVSGSTIYYRITDPAVVFTTLTAEGPVSVPAYVTGCSEVTP